MQYNIVAGCPRRHPRARRRGPLPRYYDDHDY